MGGRGGGKEGYKVGCFVSRLCAQVVFTDTLFYIHYTRLVLNKFICAM